ncbi:enoyl-CoA hydratase/isomerase family protein [Polymorphobacter sp. PAMC 29334]|uniref:enoyl-CoA hydratase/isomerase family protein n=1 Tax=Polymorphobacter sp. PAMC 29334 TaxID=2862331 RepID=UPI001C674F1D|nr:enoyl-CoA hydratase/isomerase family protein [Polymorphobacter sp. PAMC 29334]QYE34109.1 enoyl-CoA hydratase/isomerase family protein [Polymorphobacter sp. PAMC 29334]
MTDTTIDPMTAPAADVLIERRGRALWITLNRPAALNSLTRAMCNTIQAVLYDSIGDAEVALVVIEGAGERAFCAGGDVVAMHAAGRVGIEGWQAFFHDEYRMNQTIARYPDPYVAILDGMTMGGGVGLSIHGRFRVATERTLFAMPETAIGLIPDVGGTHALPRLPGHIGTWLALTGARLKAADCVYAGIATHYVPVERLALLGELLSTGDEPVETILETLNADPGEPPLAMLRDAIDYHFAHDTIEAILASLATGDDWALSTHATIAAMSPTSLKLTLRALRDGADIEGALRTEYRVVSHIQGGHDFYEGVRAVLIDKDKSPKWSPATLGMVTEAQLDPYFAEPASGDLTFD